MVGISKQNQKTQQEMIETTSNNYAMKTYHQFSEDIEKRRIELRQRSRDQMQRFKEKSKASVDAQKQRTSEIEDRKRIKDEIKRELRNEK
jgi:hypothetical protein